MVELQFRNDDIVLNFGDVIYDDVVALNGGNFHCFLLVVLPERLSTNPSNNIPDLKVIVLLQIMIRHVPEVDLLVITARQ